MFFKYRDFATETSFLSICKQNDIDDLDDNPSVSKKDIENEAKEVRHSTWHAAFWISFVFVSNYLHDIIIFSV